MKIIGILTTLLALGVSGAFAQLGARGAAVALSSSPVQSPSAMQSNQRLPLVLDDGSDADIVDTDDDSGTDEAGNYGGAKPGSAPETSSSTATAPAAAPAVTPPSADLLQSCQNEIQFLCKDNVDDQETLLDCLEDNKPGLTSGCANVFYTLRPQRKDAQ